MPIDPLAPVTTSTGAASTQGGGPTLGKDDFLKLLIGQMQNQDPLSPQDPSQQMGQLTQFSILEQLTNLTQTSTASAANNYDNEAVALLGKTVTYTKSDASSATGVVQKVTFSKDGPSLTIDGTAGIPPVAVTGVA